MIYRNNYKEVFSKTILSQVSVSKSHHLILNPERNGYQNFTLRKLSEPLILWVSSSDFTWNSAGTAQEEGGWTRYPTGPVLLRGYGRNKESLGWTSKYEINVSWNLKKNPTEPGFSSYFIPYNLGHNWQLGTFKFALPIKTQQMCSLGTLQHSLKDQIK